MQKIFLTLGILFLSLITLATDFNTPYANDFDFLISKKKDSIKNDTMLILRCIGAEAKFKLNNKGELLIILDGTQAITVKPDGFTGFGTKNPQHRLDVCGTIRASEELIVEVNEWCDFVFRADYALQPFEQRIEQVKENKHLPYIRPQSEITELGVPISETLTGLLRNVEELYLYIEQLEKRISSLETENNQLKSGLEK